jgi:prepilin-type N-terminal cleavage/methylation domain-containing protein
LKKQDYKNKEQGFTLVELLVAVSLLAIVAVAVTASIISITGTAQKFTASSTSQNVAADTISSITRDISASTSFTEADDFNITMNTVEDNQKYVITIFHWDPAKPSEIPEGASTVNLPNSEAIVQYRKISGSSTGATKVLTDGYEKGRQDQVLFTYYDKDNKVITTPITGTARNLIERVEYKFALKVKDRTGLIELASSAVPRGPVTATAGGNALTNGGCAAPVLSGSLTPKTRVAQLSWASVTNATGYTIYRENSNQGYDKIVLEVINSYATTSFSDATVAWGNKYAYTIVANCSIGTSTDSNSLRLNVTPDAPDIVNKNVSKQLTDTLGSSSESGTTLITSASVGLRYSVARALTNQVVWTPVYGAEGYRIYRDGALQATVGNTVRSSLDAGRSYGDVTNYVVVAYNSVINGSGGNSAQSNTVTLISPPSASVIAVTAKDTSTDSTFSSNEINVTSRAANTSGFVIKRHVTMAANPTCTSATEVANLEMGANNTITDSAAEKDIRWGSTACYVAVPYNAAGSGPSDSAEADQKPGKFAINYLSEDSTRSQLDSYFVLNELIDNQAGKRSDTAYTVGWTNSVGNNGSNYTIVKTKVDTSGTGPDAKVETNAANGTVFGYGNITPGTRYDFTITAKAANGLEREASTFGNTRPTIPASGHSFIQGNSGNDFRRRIEVARYAPMGHLSSVQGKTWFDGQGEKGYGSVTAAASQASFYSEVARITSGSEPTGARLKGNLSAWSWTADSPIVSWSGVVAGPCSSTCNAVEFQDSLEQAPDYYNGHHAYYNAK